MSATPRGTGGKGPCEPGAGARQHHVEGGIGDLMRTVVAVRGMNMAKELQYGTRPVEAILAAVETMSAPAIPRS